MKYKVLQWFGILSILVVGTIHFLLAPDEYKEAHYMGILFGANFLAAFIAAGGILRRTTWGWVLGLLIASGSLIGYMVSRTTGMPGMEVEDWITPSGLIAMAVEGIFILLGFLQAWGITSNRNGPPSTPV